MDPTQDPCGPTGCIYYDSGKSQYCLIPDYPCPFGAEGFKRTGDIKKAMLAWKMRGLIHPAGRGNNFTITISVRNKKMPWLTKALSSRLPLGTKFKVVTLPWWRCWFRKVAVV